MTAGNRNPFARAALRAVLPRSADLVLASILILAPLVGCSSSSSKSNEPADATADAGNDAATNPADGGSPPDASNQGPDATMHEPGAPDATVAPDATPPAPADATVPPPDANAPPPDASVPPPDAESGNPPDASSPPPSDSGTGTSVDAATDASGGATDAAMIDAGLGVTVECTSLTQGVERDCGWSFARNISCTPGHAVTVGCSAAAGCALGWCSGDPVMRLCSGTNDFCTSAEALGQNDDSCETSCSLTQVACPAEGRITVLTGAYNSVSNYTCNIVVSQ